MMMKKKKGEGYLLSAIKAYYEATMMKKMWYSTRLDK